MRLQQALGPDCKSALGYDILIRLRVNHTSGIETAMCGTRSRLITWTETEMRDFNFHLHDGGERWSWRRRLARPGAFWWFERGNAEPVLRETNLLVLRWQLLRIYFVLYFGAQHKYKVATIKCQWGVLSSRAAAQMLLIITTLILSNKKKKLPGCERLVLTRKKKNIGQHKTKTSSNSFICF